MYSCHITKPVRVRITHSIWADGSDIINPDYQFNTEDIIQFIDTVGDKRIEGVWAKLSDNRWVALEYNDQIFGEYSLVGSQGGNNTIYGFVKHDYQLYGVSRPERNNAPPNIMGLPEVHKLVDAGRIKLTKSLQYFWFGLLKKSASDIMSDIELKIAWRSLTHGGRAFTNGAGSNTHADYISNKNLNKTPMLMEPIICGGALVKIIGEGRKYGEDCWKIETINSNSVDLNITYETHPYFIYCATNSTRNILPNGTRKTEQFWQLEGRNVYVPIMTKNSNFNWIQKYKVETIDWSIGQMPPNPYNP